MQCPIEISNEAIVEIKNILKNKGIPGEYGLRVGVKGAGCGVAFKLGFDKANDRDEIFETEGVQVLIQKREMMFLIGKKVNFYNEADGRGFYFE